jgi:hypothetical protein
MDPESFRQHAKLFASPVPGVSSKEDLPDPEVSVDSMHANGGHVISFQIAYYEKSVPDENVLVRKLTAIYGPLAETTRGQTSIDRMESNDNLTWMTSRYTWVRDAVRIVLQVRNLSMPEYPSIGKEYGLEFTDVDYERTVAAADLIKRKAREDSFVP